MSRDIGVIVALAAVFVICASGLIVADWLKRSARRMDEEQRDQPK